MPRDGLRRGVLNPLLVILADQGNNLPAPWAKIVAQWAEITDHGAER